MLATHAFFCVNLMKKSDRVHQSSDPMRARGDSTVKFPTPTDGELSLITPEISHQYIVPCDSLACPLLEMLKMSIRLSDLCFERLVPFINDF